MSIYDNLADSDFLDPGKFREQLKQMSQMEGTEKSQQTLQKIDTKNSNSRFQNVARNKDTLKRQNMEGNPMDGENEMSLPPIPNGKKMVDDDIQKQLDFLKQKIQQDDPIVLPQVQKFEFSKQISEERRNFEDQIRNRVSMPQEDLFEDQNPYRNMPEASREKVDNIRQQMIFDDNLELSARNQNQQSTINTDPDRQDPKAVKSEFTLQKYESKPELQGQVNIQSEGNMETAHFIKQSSGAKDVINTNPSQKTQNTDKDNMMIDQRAFNFGSKNISSSNSHYQDSNQRRRMENEGTGQFGNKEKDQEYMSSGAGIIVDQFNAIDIKNLQHSPKIKKKEPGENDQISQLLAQLQAPNQGIHQSQNDLEKAHQQMQDSIKQMKLVADPGALHNNEYSAIDQGSNTNNGIGFNGQNSLYELAQRVGQPLSSSNIYSMSQFDGNEDDFQNFLKGEGSMGSALTNQQSNHHPYAAGAAENHHRNVHQVDQAQQLLIQMQDSQNSNTQNVRPMLVQRKQSNQNLHPKNQEAKINDKENFNAPNVMEYQNQKQIIMLNSEYQSNEQIVQPQPAVKRQMSLAERAQQAKLANQAVQMARQELDGSNYNTYQQPQQQFNQNFRQQFNPNAIPNQNYSQRPSLISQQQQQSQRPSLIQNQGRNQENFSQTNKNDKIEKRQALMANFDDIPIHQLHKADGYQIRNIDDGDTPMKEVEGRDGAFDATNEDELKNVSLKDQVFHPKWKVRLNAFRLINQQLNDWNGDEHEGPVTKEDEMYGNPENPFDIYGPIMEQMIKDTNLTAQYEGLNCLYSFIKLGKDIKQVTFACHSYLLDKIQHNKPNFVDITQRILQRMLLKRQNIIPEILKRLKSKNRGALNFCLSVINTAIAENNISIQDTNLKLIFKSTQELLGHSNKEVRDSAVQLIIFVYKNCEDDLTTFCTQFTSLRPVQLKELKDQLSVHNKNQNAGFLVKLFDKVNSESRKDLNHPNGAPERSPVGRSKSIESNKQGAKSDQDEDELQQTDLSNLTPENFNEIPYITQINVKRKSMESFNQELEKLVVKQNAQTSAFEGESTSIVKIKDYSGIFNIVVHMLEDPNMLVFIEAIKTVEFLAILLRSSIKSPKMKQFIQLLANKYKETKTAVLVALEKTFFAIYDNKCIQMNSFFDQLISLVEPHKNPRVKQLVIERIDIIITKYFLDEQEQQSPQQLLQIFKHLKDKLKQIIIKDTNNSVRDAGVNLLSKFMIIVGQSEEPLQPIQEIINSLPKYRIQEITKKIEESQFGEQISARNQLEKVPVRDKSRGNSAATGGSRCGARAKSNEKTAAGGGGGGSSQPPNQQDYASVADISEQRFLFNTKKAQIQVSNEYQMSISEIILTIKNIGSDKDRLRPQQIIDNLQQGLEDLADDGVRECKGLIIQCIYWLLNHYPSKINFLEQERQEALYAVINLMKKMYCIQREISSDQELNQAVGCALIFFALFDEHAVIVQLLNVLYVAATQKGTSLNFLNVMKHHLTKYDPSPKQIPNGKQIIISSTVFFISDKISEMMLKSQMNDKETLELPHFEEIRSIVIQEIEQCQNEGQKEMLIECIVCLRDMVKAYQEQQANKLGPNRDYGNLVMDQRSSQELGISARQQDEEISLPESKGYSDLPPEEQVLQLIDQDFEKGLLSLRELVKDESVGKIQLIFEQKQKIVLRLLNLTTQGFKNPQEQYRQAYSLKALMWLKEELIGLEECFKLTDKIMSSYIQAMVDGRDSSIEQYLLNFWTKDLSLRDLVDRANVCCSQQQQMEAEDRFNILFTWLMGQKILQDQIQWTLEDFRKVATQIAQISIIQNMTEENFPLQFIDHAVDKFGAKKVRDFMEIQLIQDNELLMKFLDQFDQKYMLQSEISSMNQNIKISKNNNIQVTNEDNELSHALFTKDNDSKGGSIMQEPLLTNRSGYNSTRGGDRSQMLQEMRDRRKEGNRTGQTEDEDLEDSMMEEKRKYDEIMARLEKHKSHMNNLEAQDADRPVAIEGLHDGRQRIQTQGMLSNNGEHQSERPTSNYNKRYSTQEGGNGSHKYQSRHEDSVGEFNDEEDFKLSMENGQSVSGPNGIMSKMLNQQRSGDNFLQLNQQSNNEIITDYSKNFGEGLCQQTEDPKRDDDSRANSQLQESRQKIRESVQYQEERLQRLESSQIKVRQMKNEMDMLEDERRKIQMERQLLLAEQNQQSEQWKARYQEMTTKNDEIVANLAQANQGYLNQVSENEVLTNQIGELQAQHRDILARYRLMEQKLQHSEQLVEEQKVQLEESTKLASFTGQENQEVIEEKQIKQIENVFGQNQMMQYGDNMGGEIGVRKIQELLLDSEGASKTLSKPMIVHYQKLRSKTDRMQMIQALKQSLENEDVLFAISAETYKSLLNFLLNAFSFEKQLIERESIQKTHEREQQNELTQEAQRLVSKLLNSKEFTASLICLLQLLKTEAMPDDISVNLTVQERQYMRVIMRCISRITKALHSENPDLVRAFDVLIEMQKLFVKHPPENLRQDLPCLSEFDYIYRGLKEVSDIMIELQPQKCMNFLQFCTQSGRETGEGTAADQPMQPTNAFIKYIQQMMHVHPAYQNHTEYTDF